MLGWTAVSPVPAGYTVQYELMGHRGGRLHHLSPYQSAPSPDWSPRPLMILLYLQ